MDRMIKTKAKLDKRPLCIIFNGTGTDREPRERMATVDLLEKCKIEVNKRTLLVLAGILWSTAGWRVLTFGYADLLGNATGLWVYLLASGAVFWLFFVKVFDPMVKRHSDRIISSNLRKHCIFSFLDFKGYAVMIVMVSGGIALRNAHIIAPFIIGSFYLGLGSALLSSGIKVLNSVLNM